MDTVKYALFDLDDTLVDTAKALRAWTHDFVAAYGLGQGEGEEAMAAKVVADRVKGARTWTEFCALAGQWYGITTPPAVLHEYVASTYPKKFTLDPRVTQGLAALRADGWLLGIVTNGSTVVQQAKIDQVGLSGHVDVIVDSEAAGTRKPERRIFEIAAERLGVELGPHGWMVGDNHAFDIVGGHDAGLRTIWIPCGVELPADALRPDHTCATAVEAIEVVAGRAVSGDARATAGAE